MNTNVTTVRAAEMLVPITVEHVMYHVGGCDAPPTSICQRRSPEGHRVPGVVMGHSVIMVKEALRPPGTRGLRGAGHRLSDDRVERGQAA